MNLFIFALLVLSTVSSAQWSWIAGTPPMTRINDISGFSANNILAVGQYGNIYQTSNVGDSWLKYKLGNGQDLRVVHFFNDTSIIVCGSTGNVFRSEDAGVNWSTIALPSADAVSRMFILDNQIGFISTVSGKLMKTSDGGYSWSLLPGTIPTGVGDMIFYDSLTGIRGTTSAHYRTTDGGLSWQLMVSGNGALRHLHRISATSSYGFAIDGTMLVSSDKGLTWQIRHASIGGVGVISFVDSLHGGLFAFLNKYYLTSDGGNTFIEKAAPTSFSSYSSAFMISQNIILTSSSTGHIHTTLNNGESWNEILTFDHRPLRSIAADGFGYIAVGDNGLMLSVTTAWPSILNSPVTARLNGISVSDRYAYIVGENGVIVRRRSNPSAIWDSLSSPVSSDLFAVYLMSQYDLFYAVGENGTIVKGNLLGTILTDISITTTHTLRAVSILSPAKAIAVGDGGSVYITNDTGNTWIQKNVSTTENLLGVSFFESLGTISGDNGTCLRSTDGGETWAPAYILESSALNSVGLWSNYHGRLVSESGKIYYTSNGGQSWVVELSVPQVGLGFIAAQSATHSSVALKNGMVLFRNSSVPVELKTFTGRTSQNKIILEWLTATETNNRGFELQKLHQGNQWNTIGFLPGRGTTTAESAYEFIDMFPDEGTNTYRLIQFDFDGTQEVHGTVEVDFIVNDFSLAQNYPNPFNPATTVEYSVGRYSFVELKIFDILGSEIRTIFSGFQNPGKYTLKIDAADLPAGIYFYRFFSEHYSASRKMVVLK